MKRKNIWEEKLELNISNPPKGSYKIMNIYITPDLKLKIEYDDAAI